MKKRIRLTEAQLHNVIRRCVNEALDGDNDYASTGNPYDFDDYSDDNSGEYEGEYNYNQGDVIINNGNIKINLYNKESFNKDIKERDYTLVGKEYEHFLEEVDKNYKANYVNKYRGKYYAVWETVNKFIK